MDPTTAVVTGADQPLGRSLVAALAGMAATVVVDAPEAASMGDADHDGTNVVALRTDVRDEYDLERLMEAAGREGPSGIDLVVPCARARHAPPDGGPFDGSYAGFDDEVRTVVRGTYAAMREAVPHLAEDGLIVVPIARADAAPSTARVHEVTLEGVVRLLGPSLPVGVVGVDVGSIPLAPAAEADAGAAAIVATLEGWDDGDDGRVLEAADLG